MTEPIRRRDGGHTKDQILSTALDLFIEHGYEGTSVRDISDALGITASALYYHFPGKEAIATSLLEQRGSELDELAQWIRDQPPAADLARRATLRWIDHVTPQQLQAMRFAGANQPFMQKLGARGEALRFGFAGVIAALVPAGASVEDQLRVRMLFDVLTAALRAAEGTGATPDQILAAARAAAASLPLPADA